ncbi:MAG TPA: hypothetical protein VNA17_09970 [Pyrinomonadaceae bacterium]|nr:hypothetical protein [Pyrinomonadaceae bacterium]
MPLQNNASNFKQVLEEMIRLYTQERLTLEQIGSHFGMTKQGVPDRLVRAGVQMRSRSFPPTPIEYDLLHRLYVIDELSLHKTAAELGTSKSIVVDALKRNGINRRKTGHAGRTPKKIRAIRATERVCIGIRCAWIVGPGHPAYQGGIRNAPDRCESRR